MLHEYLVGEKGIEPKWFNELVMKNPSVVGRSRSYMEALFDTMEEHGSPP